jgi:hypothetical protein
VVVEAVIILAAVAVQVDIGHPQELLGAVRQPNLN